MLRMNNDGSYSMSCYAGFGQHCRYPQDREILFVELTDIFIMRRSPQEQDNIKALIVETRGVVLLLHVNIVHSEAASVFENEKSNTTFILVNYLSENFI